MRSVCDRGNAVILRLQGTNRLHTCHKNAQGLISVNRAGFYDDARDEISQSH